MSMSKNDVLLDEGGGKTWVVFFIFVFVWVI